jgi:hypothetical protein
MKNSYLIFLAILMIVVGCSRAPVVSLTNRSGFTLSNVVVSGSGFTNTLGDIETGSERRLVIRSRGESGLRVVFDVSTNHIDSGEQGYFESGGGYSVAATVNTNLNVTVVSDLRAY